MTGCWRAARPACPNPAAGRTPLKIKRPVPSIQAFTGKIARITAARAQVAHILPNLACAMPGITGKTPPCRRHPPLCALRPPLAAWHGMAANETPRQKRGVVSAVRMHRRRGLRALGTDHDLRTDHDRTGWRCRIHHDGRRRAVVDHGLRLALALFLELAVALPLALHLAVAVPEFFLVAAAFVLVAVAMVVMVRQHRQRERAQQGRQQPAGSQRKNHCSEPEKQNAQAYWNATRSGVSNHHSTSAAAQQLPFLA